MQSFPKVLRIPPAAWAYNQIMGIYLGTGMHAVHIMEKMRRVMLVICSALVAKIDADREMEHKGMSKQPLAEFTHSYFTKTAGLAACADVLTSQLFKACETQINLPRIAVFAAQVGWGVHASRWGEDVPERYMCVQVGLADKNQPPQLDVRDTEFILLLLSKMNECQQEQLRLQAAAQESKGAAGKVRKIEGRKEGLWCVMEC